MLRVAERTGSVESIVDQGDRLSWIGKDPGAENDLGNIGVRGGRTGELSVDGIVASWDKVKCYTKDDVYAVVPALNFIVNE